MTGISSVMARMEQIQSMAIRVGPGFQGALGAAMAGDASTATAPISDDPRLRTPDTPTVDATDAASENLPPGAARWQASIDRAARANGIDPKLLTAVVWVESGFRQDAVSHAGAIGLAQLMPGTADQLAVDPYDPDQNLDGGARFLSAMIDRFGRTDLALAAYNAGPARVGSLWDGGDGVPVAEGYVTAVFDKYKQLGGTP
jgi:soluble lytic murein transglycosylase-like protein